MLNIWSQKCWVENFEWVYNKKNGLVNTQIIKKPKMVRLLKSKFLIALKLNFNGGQFYTKI